MSSLSQINKFHISKHSILLTHKTDTTLFLLSKSKEQEDEMCSQFCVSLRQLMFCSNSRKNGTCSGNHKNAILTLMNSPQQTLSTGTVESKMNRLREMKICLSQENQKIKESELINLESLKKLEELYGQYQIKQIEDDYLIARINEQQEYETDAYQKAILIQNHDTVLIQYLDTIQNKVQGKSYKTKQTMETTSHAFYDKNTNLTSKMKDRNGYNQHFFERAIESEEIAHKKSYEKASLFSPY